jgi:hypothetical protein
VAITDPVFGTGQGARWCLDPEVPSAGVSGVGKRLTGCLGIDHFGIDDLRT